MTKAETILGLDIGGTHFRMGLVDRSYRAHNVEVHSTRALFTHTDPLEALAGAIAAYIQRAPGGQKPAMVCAGLPAVLDHDRRRVWSATNFPALENRDLVTFFQAHLGLPVQIEHDAYYLLAYDIMANGLANRGTMIGCYFGTGFGNAMYINGAPYIGKNGVACEIGHMPVPLGTKPCSCGNTGCIEMYSCGKALEKLAGEHYPAEDIGGLFTRHSTEEPLTAFVRYMAAAVATEINIMDPDHVFLGGGIVQMPDFPKQALQEAILANTRKPYPAANLCLHFSKSAPENGIIGAAIEGFRKLDASV